MTPPDPAVPRSPQQERTRHAIRKCAEWLAACIELGWLKSDLDFLEALWWRYHDHKGNLVADNVLTAIPPSLSPDPRTQEPEK